MLAVRYISALNAQHIANALNHMLRNPDVAYFEMNFNDSIEMRRFTVWRPATDGIITLAPTANKVRRQRSLIRAERPPAVRPIWSTATSSRRARMCPGAGT